MNSEAITKVKLTKDQLKKLFDKIDWSWIKDWSKKDQEDVQRLIKDLGILFTLNDFDLSKTFTVKYAIKLTDYTPIKEWYCGILPHQFDEVRKQLQEMLEIEAIKHSKSPRASAVVLVQKKGGILRFCINLRKLNAHTVKDAYSLPRITETLDCLNGVQ